jgi:hypothetical protein
MQEPSKWRAPQLYTSPYRFSSKALEELDELAATVAILDLSTGIEVSADVGIQFSLVWRV